MPSLTPVPFTPIGGGASLCDRWFDQNGYPRFRHWRIYLGLRDAVLAQYACDWIIDIEDISAFVAEQRPVAQVCEYADLVTPREEVYRVRNPETAARIGVAPVDPV